MRILHRHTGAVRIVQQKWFQGRLITIAECGGCRCKYRLETLEDAAPYIEALRLIARQAMMPGGGGESRAKFHATVADRIEAGYTAPELRS